MTTQLRVPFFSLLSIIKVCVIKELPMRSISSHLRKLTDFAFSARSLAFQHKMKVTICQLAPTSLCFLTVNDEDDKAMIMTGGGLPLVASVAKQLLDT